MNMRAVRRKTTPTGRMMRQAGKMPDAADAAPLLWRFDPQRQPAGNDPVANIMAAPERDSVTGFEVIGNIVTDHRQSHLDAGAIRTERATTGGRLPASPTSLPPTKLPVPGTTSIRWLGGWLTGSGARCSSAT